MGCGLKVAFPGLWGLGPSPARPGSARLGSAVVVGKQGPVSPVRPATARLGLPWEFGWRRLAEEGSLLGRPEGAGERGGAASTKPTEGPAASVVTISACTFCPHKETAQLTHASGTL